MGTTTRGIPYPEPTDPVADGAAAIRAIAEAVDPVAGTDSGWDTLTLPGSFTAGAVTYRKVGRMVTIILSGNKSAAGYNGAIPLATLPTGFRPSQVVRGLCVVMTNNGDTGAPVNAGRLDVITDGTVNIRGSFTSTSYVSGTLTFPV